MCQNEGETGNETKFTPNTAEEIWHRAKKPSTHFQAEWPSHQHRAEPDKKSFRISPFFQQLILSVLALVFFINSFRGFPFNMPLFQIFSAVFL